MEFDNIYAITSVLKLTLNYENRLELIILHYATLHSIYRVSTYITFINFTLGTQYSNAQK